MIPCGQRINKNEKHEERLVMFTNQQEDSDRCESMELDNKIRDLIERNDSPDLKGATPGATPGHRNSCSLKTPGKTASMAYCIQGTTRMSAAESSSEHGEILNLACQDLNILEVGPDVMHDQSSSRKNLTSSLEQKIRCLEKQRKELLEVNQQWDQQFRSMKELYERKVAEMKMKLDAAERFLSSQEKERLQSQRESDRLHDQTRQRLQLEEKEKESLSEELHEVKKENKLLKEKNTLASKKKEQYECEIKRLNKALQDALKIECSSFPEDCLGKSELECRHKEMRTEMEVLKQQVQIYEEDFKKERSDRERLNQEKETLQQIIQTSQSELNRLNSQIKACQMEKEKLEKQLKQPDYQWYAPDQFPPDVQHKANGFSSEKKVNQ